MAVILGVLKFIGILLLILLGLLIFICAVVLFVPVCYFAECRNHEKLHVGVTVSWLFHAIKMKKSISENRIKIYLFGINIVNYKNIFRKKNRKEDIDISSSVSKVNLVDDFYDGAQKHDDAVKEKEEKQKVHIETDYEEKTEKKMEKVSGHRKKSFPFNGISSIISFIRDYENKSGLRKIRKELAGLIKYLMPRSIKGKIIFGTGDPCTTGWILGAISMFPVAYTEGVTILPDFEEKVFEVDGYVKGKIRIFYFLGLFLRGYMDEDIKTIIRKVLKRIGK